MKIYIIILTLILNCTTCNSQENITYQLVGGACEGCEAIFEYGERLLTPSDTLMDFSLQGPKLKISGTVYQDDEISPAKDVIIYIYHTNQSGIYPTNGDEKGWARRHGYIRGWMKTDDAGIYFSY